MAEKRVSLVTERTCWRRELARRVAFLVDGQSYFDALARALRQARHSVHLLGWDIHSKVALRPQAGPGEDPCVLGELLDEITRRNRKLDVRLLVWDPSPVFALEREFLPLARIAWGTGRRVHVQLAADHPAGGSHHQKVVVIDDALAFLGGLDLTVNRWDERDHRRDNPHRVLPDGEPYEPFHDVMVAVDGDAAAALGSLVRERWRSATEEHLARPPGGSDPWPASLTPSLRDVKVGIARTQPKGERSQPAREVEALFLTAIAAARHCIYVENQYVTSQSIGEALSRRLREPDGPEVIILTPREQSGSLERLTMGVLRTRVLAQLRAADTSKRLRIFCPVVSETWVHVHSKVMVIDDHLLIIGSANLCNRSMSLDTECNVALESDGDERVARAIRGLRDGLLAEHLGVTEPEAARAIDRLGSVRAAVEQLSGGAHALRPVDFPLEQPLPALVPVAELVDSVVPVDEALVRRAMPVEWLEASRRKLPRLLAVLFLALGLAAAWTWTPMKDWLQPGSLAELAEPLRTQPWGPLAGVVMFAFATLLLVPLLVLVVVTVLLFGTWTGFLTALSGCMLGALVAYGLGRQLMGDVVRRVAGKRLEHLARKIAERGLLAMVAVRLVPIAPFAVVNLVAGSAHIRLRDFLLGTLIGLAPGTLVLALAADRVAEVAKNPSPGAFIAASALVLVAVLAIYGASRLFERLRGLRPPRPSGAA